jgi:hypothetical protein
MRRIPVKMIPMPTLTTGEREVFWKREAVGLAVTVVGHVVVREVEEGAWVVVVAKVEEDGNGGEGG